MPAPTMTANSPTRRGIQLAAGCALLLAPLSAQATTTLIPVADTGIHFSTAGERSSGAGSFAVIGNNGVGLTGQPRRYLVRFDVAGALPAGATILAVDFAIPLEKNVNGARAATLNRLTRTWGEGPSNADAAIGLGAVAMAGDSSWGFAFYPNDPWTTPGGDFASPPSASNRIILPGIPESLAWSSTTDPGMVADVQSWLDQPTGNHGWIVRSVETEAATGYVNRTRESVGSEPTLTITWQLPPASITSFGTGCAKGGNPPLQLQAGTAPALGTTFGVQLTGGGPAAFRLVYLSPGRLTNPGTVFGCPLWIDTSLPLVTLITDAAGAVSSAIPSNPALAGLTLHAQGAAILSGSLRIVTSNGLTGILGG